jgi:hypothetical protein
MRLAQSRSWNWSWSLRSLGVRRRWGGREAIERSGGRKADLNMPQGRSEHHAAMRSEPSGVSGAGQVRRT